MKSIALYLGWADPRGFQGLKMRRASDPSLQTRRVAYRLPTGPKAIIARPIAPTAPETRSRPIAAC
jgi:hypothetical protein